MDEREAVLRLLRTSGLGHARVRALRQEFGSASAALCASVEDFAAAIAVARTEAARMTAEARAGPPVHELARLEEMGARTILEGDEDYPALLAVMPDPPPALFVRGEVGGDPEVAVAVVGSRRATAYGRLQSGRIAGDLAARGVTVVSGGARGIDAEAHRAALRAGGRTIAVVATGLDQPYPAEHAPLYESIVNAGGALVSEQPLGVSARPDLFPRRNRMIAGISLVTVVVEAASRSGALLTARLSVDDLSRSAGCVPGPIDSPTSEGCHRAIREGWAQLVTSADDVCVLVEEMRMAALGARHRAPARPCRARIAGEDPGTPCEPRRIGVDAAEVLRTVTGAGRAGLDEIERALAWTVPRIALATLELEREGLVARDAEGAFRPISGAACRQEVP